MPKILVIDDDPDIRDLVDFKLTQGGFEVVTESDGEAGIATAIAAPPDLVLLDWMMPNVTGIDVCEQLRADARTAGVPIILLTAKAQEAAVERGFAAGADDYIVKPFSPRELVSRVESLLGQAVAGP